MKSALFNPIKIAGYRLGFGRPRYSLKISPGQVAFLCDAIVETREIGGAVLEIGVAKGDTSVVLLEHLRTTNDDRRAYFLDTFSGFPQAQLDDEAKRQKKSAQELNKFKYGDEAIFKGNLERLGYQNFDVVAGDAAGLDYDRFGPISVALLDIDLYGPTKAILPKLWERLTTPGFICVDDCVAEGRWDGSLQAYMEFVTAMGLQPEIVGNKGGVIVKR